MEEGGRRKGHGGFRAAEVIESSHYRYTVALLLSFALLMIYRKQINDLNSPNKLRKTWCTCGGSRIVSRDSSRALSFVLPAFVCASPSADRRCSRMPRVIRDAIISVKLSLFLTLQLSFRCWIFLSIDATHVPSLYTLNLLSRKFHVISCSYVYN